MAGNVKELEELFIDFDVSELLAVKGL